ncbi:Membrane protein involved in the export of O-antigen and teichoic acid [Oribacterium sp. KHPX15]|uniref:flippase n=1 Tax=Oribacterium sp. KHPX15 TaxID=1855342 RepID=UPI0008984A74|nr:flippase [Oribacterium sp. KHPX15]SEA81637.1 Membrane protein involved in the export of O-antigen and teichoic acid [Oribacterium sp. KHPX15]
MKTNSLFFNSIFNVIYRFLNILFPLITAAYVARVLDSSLIGEIAYVQNITQYFVLTATLGLPNYGTREIAKIRENSRSVNRTFSELLILNSMSTTVCLALYTLLILIVQSFRINKILFVITGLSIVLNYINVDWMYQGFEQYRYIAVRSFIVKSVSLIAVLLFVKHNEDYLLYAFITSMAIAGNNIYNIFNLRKFGISLTLNGISLRKHLIPVFSLLLTTVAIELYTLLDTTMIGMLCSKDNVAFYNYAIRITKAIIVVMAAIGGVLLPRLSFYRGNGDNESCSIIVEKTLNILFFLLIPSAIGLGMCSREIVIFLYGTKFIKSIPILRISTLLIITLGFSNLFGTQILVTYNAEKKLLASTFIGAISNIFLNMFLIRLYQGEGAAIASVVSEGLVTLSTYIFAGKYLKIKADKHDIICSIIASIIMTLIIIGIKLCINNISVLLFAEVSIGIIVYFVITICLKNSVAVYFLNKIKKLGGKRQTTIG